MPKHARRLAPLLLLLAFILFPLEWLGLKWHPLGAAQLWQRWRPRRPNLRLSLP